MFNRRQFVLTSAGLATAMIAVRGGADTDKPAEGKFEVMKTDEEWKKQLTPEQYSVLRKHGTERAGTSSLDKNYSPGTYACAGCGLPVYSSEAKYDSGTGWPSFWKPLDNAVETSIDKSWFTTRTEVHCRRCGGHLGHVFEDGPAPTGLRYCMNGVALKFEPKAG
jgi:peptide-methionine (R)-S-oxide reductase